MYCSGFVVNSEPHTGARPSVHYCVGPELARCVHTKYFLCGCWLYTGGGAQIDPRQNSNIDARVSWLPPPLDVRLLFPHTCLSSLTSHTLQSNASAADKRVGPYGKNIKS
jgi:hypothetical protein